MAPASGSSRRAASATSASLEVMPTDSPILRSEPEEMPLMEILILVGAAAIVRRARASGESTRAFAVLSDCTVVCSAETTAVVRRESQIRF